MLWTLFFYGKLGEMKTNKTEDQELSVLCLHLLQACMVYINTLIIQQVLYAEHWQNKLTAKITEHLRHYFRYISIHMVYSLLILISVYQSIP